MLPRLQESISRAYSVRCTEEYRRASDKGLGELRQARCRGHGALGLVVESLGALCGMGAEIWISLCI